MDCENEVAGSGGASFLVRAPYFDPIDDETVIALLFVDRRMDGREVDGVIVLFHGADIFPSARVGAGSLLLGFRQGDQLGGIWMVGRLGRFFWGYAAIVGDGFVGTFFEQRLDGSRIAILCSEVERGFAFFVPCIDVDVMAERFGQDAGISCIGGEMQECVAVIIDQGPVRAVFQCIDGIRLLLLDGIRQWCILCVVDVFFLFGICLLDFLQDFHVSGTGSRLQWCLSVRVAQAGIEASLEEELRHLLIFVFDGCVECFNGVFDIELREVFACGLFLIAATSQQECADGKQAEACEDF